MAMTAIQKKLSEVEVKIAELLEQKEKLEVQAAIEKKLGNKVEKQAFIKAMEHHVGFGFSYPQALAILKLAAANHEPTNQTTVQNLERIGEPLMAEFLAKPKPAENPHTESPEAPEAAENTAATHPGEDDDATPIPPLNAPPAPGVDPEEPPELDTPPGIGSFVPFDD